MTTARDIRNDLRDAEEHGRNLYMMPLWMTKQPSGAPKHGLRIIGARTKDGITQALLATGKWYTIASGDAFYIQ